VGSGRREKRAICLRKGWIGKREGPGTGALAMIREKKEWNSGHLPQRGNEGGSAGKRRDYPRMQIPQPKGKKKKPVTAKGKRREESGRGRSAEEKKKKTYSWSRVL